MSRSLTKRIDKLERLWSAPERGRSPLVLCIELENVAELGSGERIVEDWFRDSGFMVWARERVTTDKADEGRRCLRGGYLLDVLEAFHEGCPWRERTGVCQMCQGTPVEDRDFKGEGAAIR
jgi:hypothetical protein